MCVDCSNSACFALLLRLAHTLFGHIFAHVFPIDLCSHNGLNLLFATLFKTYLVLQHAIGEELVLVKADAHVDFAWLDKGLLHEDRLQVLEDRTVYLVDELLQIGMRQHDM